MAWQSETSSETDYSNDIPHHYNDRTLCDRSHIMSISLTPKHEHIVPDPAPEKPPSKVVKQLLIALRVASTAVSVGLFCCVAGMDVYMLLNQRGIVLIPLFICRVMLMAALVVLILCEWSLAPRITSYFPMYNEGRSWKGFGFSQIVVAFFVMSDSTMTAMQDSRSTSDFARILFPLVVTFGILMVVVGACYLVAGVLGGADLKASMSRNSNSNSNSNSSSKAGMGA
ncbi:hypothetical protein GGI12_000190 [Dipsacomyces acuminosporus]|nr:hypothetical protein GGI12_000190 [Dipsacomyces acuminosporus]